MAAFDAIKATAIKRPPEPQLIVGDLLTAEINEKQARSIKHPRTILRKARHHCAVDFLADDSCRDLRSVCKTQDRGLNAERLQESHLVHQFLHGGIDDAGGVGDGGRHRSACLRRCLGGPANQARHQHSADDRPTREFGDLAYVSPNPA